MARRQRSFFAKRNQGKALEVLFHNVLRAQPKDKAKAKSKKAVSREAKHEPSNANAGPNVLQRYALAAQEEKVAVDASLSSLEAVDGLKPHENKAFEKYFRKARLPRKEAEAFLSGTAAAVADRKSVV